MTPPAPDLLSTTQDWPQLCWRKAASRRATISVVPPGAAGTTMRVPAPGFQAASACKLEGTRAAAGQAVAVATSVRRERLRAMTFPYFLLRNPTPRGPGPPA